MVNDSNYNFKKIEQKWQKKWDDAKVFTANDTSNKKKFYVLEMFPYPSGGGLHMGHAFNYTIGDICARFMRMRGFNVLYPMGYDSFGLPAENAAIKSKSHPKKFTEEAISNFIRQQKELGLSYDWSRMLKTSSPEYYKWNQFFFLQFLKNGLAYRKKASVNWCPKCDTVLANEQVHNGRCWRHEDTEVEIKQLEQWFLKITKYQEELLKDLEKINWPERIKIMQKNWIGGESEGTIINFRLKGSRKILPTFTTRSDTQFGVTCFIYAPEHPDVMEIVKGTPYEKKVKEFVKRVVIEQKFTRAADDREKEGMFIGAHAINPVNNEEVPIYIANFVLLDYGTGAIQCVPAHDQRDYEFAKKYKLPIKRVIEPINKGVNIIIDDRDNSEIAQEIRKLSKRSYQISPDEKSYSLNDRKFISNHFSKELLSQNSNFIIRYPGSKIESTGAFVGLGKLINSGEFTGLTSEKAKAHITKFLNSKKAGKRATQFKLRDWLISRQRYWGTPIPVIYCGKCGIIPVPEKDLPVLLPEDIKFGKGNPLATSKSFVNAKCPKCNGSASRETDTMDTFFDSSWYFLRYLDPHNSKIPFAKKLADYWVPVDQYIGGAEHACMHLIYSRFFTKALRDLGFVSSNINEPFSKLFNQGMLHGSDGFVMSKSRGNVVLPEEISRKYGIDTARLFMMSIATLDKDTQWSDEGIAGSFKFVNKMIDFFGNYKIVKNNKNSKLDHYANKAVKEITSDIESFRYNLAIIRLREFFDKLSEDSDINYISFFIRLLSPFAPHLAEEFWGKIGNKNLLCLSEWPKHNDKKINPEIEKDEKAIDKTISDIINIKKIVNKDKPEVYLYTIPSEVKIYEDNKDMIQTLSESRIIKIFAVNDSKKHDPQGKSSKAKPGKPAIYIE